MLVVCTSVFGWLAASFSLLLWAAWPVIRRDAIVSRGDRVWLRLGEPEDGQVVHYPLVVVGFYDGASIAKEVDL